MSGEFFRRDFAVSIGIDCFEVRCAGRIPHHVTLFRALTHTLRTRLSEFLARHRTISVQINISKVGHLPSPVHARPGPHTTAHTRTHTGTGTHTGTHTTAHTGTHTLPRTTTLLPHRRPAGFQLFGADEAVAVRIKIGKCLIPGHAAHWHVRIGAHFFALVLRFNEFLRADHFVAVRVETFEWNGSTQRYIRRQNTCG